MKKEIILTFMMFLLVACVPKVFNQSYDKMQISSKGINSYILSLRLSGDVNNTKINENIRVTNYNDSEYEINYQAGPNKNVVDSRGKIFYIKDKKVYSPDDKNHYVLDTTKVYYTNPNIYLEGLKEVRKVSKTTHEKIGNETYDVYDVTFSKNYISKLLSDTTITDKIKDECIGTIYIDKDGYLYRIIYRMGNLKISASYLNINKVNPINFPKTIP